MQNCFIYIYIYIYMFRLYKCMVKLKIITFNRDSWSGSPKSLRNTSLKTKKESTSPLFNNFVTSKINDVNF